MRELRVADAVDGREVVALEEREGTGRSLSSYSARRSLHSLVEERAHELLVEELVRLGHRRRAPARRDLALGAVEVERQGLHPAAALQARRRLPHVHHEAIGADANERAEARLAWLVALEPRFLKRVGEETLRQIARIVRVEAPGESKVLVDRLPVALDEVAERRAPGVGIGVANALDGRMPGCGKAASETHVIRFHYPPPALSVPTRHGVQVLMRSRKGDGELGLSYPPSRVLRGARRQGHRAKPSRADFGRVGEACMLFERAGY